MAQRDTADKEAARMFFTSALSFNFAKSPYFRQFCRTLANGNLAGYTPPTYNRLCTTLLAQEKEHINRKLQPIRDSWRKRGVSIVSNGWSDKQKRPLINVMGASAGGAMFIKAINASGNIKDGEYMAAMFIDAIKQIQILKLALKSICDPSEKSPQYAYCKWIADLVIDVENIRNFIVNHEMALAIYNKYSKLCLLRVADTRFAYAIVMSKRLREVRPALEKMLMDSNWRIYRDGSNEGKSQEVKTCVVNDVWWDNLDYFLSFTEPIYNMLRVADTNSPVFHLIYDMWDTMIENVKKIVFEHEERFNFWAFRFF
ncbi:uncharacterized protein LOC111388271 [Olea europaea var. sylvestris]|uniref:uncharacterized protein LOC111388271 n=1 Tax=Olea europaea var. sylvestris TaxID=158386 RepID=UPI000C1CD507|nr:uncharacterized protein LOC111388271 [Olea europaea var. sylvestris]